MLHCVLVKVCNVKGGKKKTEVKLLSQLYRERADSLSKEQMIILIPATVMSWSVSHTHFVSMSSCSGSEVSSLTTAFIILLVLTTS